MIIQEIWDVNKIFWDVFCDLDTHAQEFLFVLSSPVMFPLTLYYMHKIIKIGEELNKK